MKNPCAPSSLFIPLLFSFTALTACSSMPGAYESNDLSHLSLRDKRTAENQIQVFSVAPEKGQAMGKISSKRCQVTVFSEAPEHATLLMDMKAEAYRLGANAISDVSFDQKGAISEGCWNLFTVSADMYVLE